MAWIDYKKSNDFVSHSWLRECMEMLGIVKNERLSSKSMEQW